MSTKSSAIIIPYPLQQYQNLKTKKKKIRYFSPSDDHLRDDGLYEAFLYIFSIFCYIY